MDSQSRSFRGGLAWLCLLLLRCTHSATKDSLHRDAEVLHPREVVHEVRDAVQLQQDAGTDLQQFIGATAENEHLGQKKNITTHT